MSYNPLTFAEIYGSIQANSTIFILRKIPLIGNLLPNRIYRYKRLKFIFGILGTAVDILKKAIGGNLGIYISLSFIPSILSKIATTQNWPDQSTLVALFIILVCVGHALNQSDIFKSNAEDYTFLNHFMINPTRYYHYKIVKGFIIEGLFVAPILIYIFKDIIIASSLILTGMFFIEAGNVFFLSIYKKNQKIPGVKKRVLLSILFMVIIYAISLTGIFSNLTMPLWLLAIISLFEILGLVLCFRYLFKFKGYKQIAVQYANSDTVALKVAVVSSLNNEDATAFTTADWETNKAYFESNKNLNELKYIQKAFQVRFKKSLRSFYTNQAYFNIFLCVLVGVLIRFDVVSIDASNILKYTPMLITLVLNLTFGRNYMQICFRYMDMPMLYHHMYDTKKVANSMSSRLFLLLKNDLISFVVLILGFVALILIAGISIPMKEFALVCLAYILILAIYEVYDVIIYYLLQPYSVDLNVKNPIFKVLSYIEGIFYVLVLFARNNVIEIIPALLISLAVILIIFAITSKIAHKTFKLRY